MMAYLVSGSALDATYLVMACLVFGSAVDAACVCADMRLPEAWNCAVDVASAKVHCTFASYAVHSLP